MNSTATGQGVTTAQNPEVLLNNQLKEMYGRVAYTHATHLNEMRIVACSKARFEIAETILTALSSTALVGGLLQGNWVKEGAIVAAALTTLSLGLSLYSRYSKHAELVTQHKSFASELWKIREQLLSMLFDLQCGAEIDELRAQRNGINAKLATLYASAPVTSAEAFSKSQQQLKSGTALFFEEWELNRMLPDPLRTAAGTDRPNEAKKS